MPHALQGVSGVYELTTCSSEAGTWSRSSSLGGHTTSFMFPAGSQKRFTRTCSTSHSADLLLHHKEESQQQAGSVKFFEPRSHLPCTVCKTSVCTTRQEANVHQLGSSLARDDCSLLDHACLLEPTASILI